MSFMSCTVGAAVTSDVRHTWPFGADCNYLHVFLFFDARHDALEHKASRIGRWAPE